MGFRCGPSREPSVVEQFVEIEQDRQRTRGAEHPADRLIELRGVYYWMAFDVARRGLHDAQHAIDDEADDLVMEVDDHDARVVCVLSCLAMPELAGARRRASRSAPRREMMPTTDGSAFGMRVTARGVTISTMRSMSTA